MNTSQYFQALHSGLDQAMEIARTARSRGMDPTLDVEIPPATDLPERVDKLIGMHRAGTMNYYYANADSGCLSGLKALADHVNEVAASARKNGYPRLKEDEKP